MSAPLYCKKAEAFKDFLSILYFYLKWFESVHCKLKLKKNFSTISLKHDLLFHVNRKKISKKVDLNQRIFGSQACGTGIFTILVD